MLTFVCSPVLLLFCIYAKAQTISLDNPGIAQLCIQKVYTFNITTTGTFNSNNVFYIELSDSNGLWGAPVKIGGILATAGGAISCMVPNPVKAATGYRLRAISTSPSLTSANNGYDLTVSGLPLYINVSRYSICTVEDSIRLNETYHYFSSYLWSTGDTNDSIYVTSAGTYKLTVFNGCANVTDSVNIGSYPKVKPKINMAAGYINPFCYHDSLKLQADNNYSSMVWYNGKSGTSLFVKKRDTVFYSAKDFNSCKIFSDTVIAKHFPYLVKNVTGDMEACPGQMVLLTVDGGVKHKWYGTAYNDSTPISSPDSNATLAFIHAADTVLLKTTDIYNCNYYDTIAISINPSCPAEPEFAWGKYGGTKQYDAAAGMDIDLNGNAYVIVELANDTVRIDSLVIPPPPCGNNIFVKYDANGKRVWLKKISGTGICSALVKRIVTDKKNGFVYILGEYRTNVNFDSVLVLKDTASVFIAKYDLNGNVLSAWAYGGPGPLFPWDFDLDSQGNLIVAGSFTEVTTLRGVKYNSVNGNNTKSNIILFKISSVDGSVSWAKVIGGRPGYNNDYCIPDVLDVEEVTNTIYLGGRFKGYAILDGISITSYTSVATSIQNAFYSKLNPDGSGVWLKRLVNKRYPDDIIYDIHTDSYGNMLFTGLVRGKVVIGKDSLNGFTGYGPGDAFLVKTDSSGSTTWFHRSGSKESQADAGKTIQTDEAGNIYSGIQMKTDAFSDHFFSASPYGNYMFRLSYSDVETFSVLFKYSPEGIMQWYKKWDASVFKTLVLHPITTDMYVAGIAQLNLVLGPDLIKTSDPYWAKLGKFSNVSSADPILPDTLCTTSSYSMKITPTGIFNAGNQFIVLLSDSLGNFAVPDTIGTVTNTAGGTINWVVPFFYPKGNRYRFKIVSTDPYSITFLNKLHTITSCSIPTRIEDRKKTVEWLLYPNPASHHVSLYKINGANERRSNVRIVDAIGKTVYQSEAFGGVVQLDISVLKAGIYFVVIEMEGELYTDKIIKN